MLKFGLIALDKRDGRYESEDKENTNDNFCNKLIYFHRAQSK